MSNGKQILNTESLLAVPIKDDEIFELLERLAATEEMFKTPVSTIRDVAELTDASPTLIARILGEMRGPDEIEKLTNRVDKHEARLRWVESKIIAPITPNPAVTRVTDPQPNSVPPVVQPQSLVWSTPRPSTPAMHQATKEDWDRYRKWVNSELAIDPYELERNSRRTQTTVGVVVIVLIILTWTVASIMDSEASQRHLPPPYEQQMDSRIIMEKN